MHTGRLVFTPADPFFVPQGIENLLERLRQIQFCSKPVQGMEAGHYLLGERFMQLVTFMGCSPFIQFEPTEDNQPFCHLVIDGPHHRPIFLAGKNTTPPRCEGCKKRIPQWEELMEKWDAAPKTFQVTCPHCGQRQNPVSYNWRQSAGSGRLFLFVENIFPNEAIPSPELMKSLQTSDTSNTAWDYFYIQD